MLTFSWRGANATVSAEGFVETGACVGAAFGFAAALATLISGGNIVRHLVNYNDPGKYILSFLRARGKGRARQRGIS